MLNYLWLIDLSLTANSLLFLAMISAAWLYFDLLQKEKQRYALWSAGGFVLLAISFVFKALAAENLLEYALLIDILQLSGLASIFIALGLEKIAGLPSMPQTTTLNSILPLLFLSFAGIKLILVLLIISKLIKKVTYGLNKQFKSLLWFWLILCIYFVYDLIFTIGNFGVTQIQINTDFGTIGWLIAQIVCILAAVILFHWIYNFISFRVFARIFISVWQLITTAGILLAISYSVFTVRASEQNAYHLLEKNLKLFNFNIEQIKKYNYDLLQLVSNSTDFDLTADQGLADIYSENIKIIVANSSTLDQLIYTDGTAIVKYDSLNPQDINTSISSNPLLKNTLITKQSSAGFVIENDATSAGKLTYQVSLPIVNKKQELTGSLLAVKSIDDAYLDLIKQASGQEFIIYVNGQRTASTLLQKDQLSRLQNLPLLNTNPEQKISFTHSRILDTPYYLVSQGFKLSESDEQINLVLAIEEKILIETNRSALINTFILTILINLLATIPSYFLAKSLNQNIKS